MIKRSMALCMTLRPTPYSTASRARDGRRSPISHSPARIRARSTSATARYGASRGMDDPPVVLLYGSWSFPGGVGKLLHQEKAAGVEIRSELMRLRRRSSSRPPRPADRLSAAKVWTRRAGAGATVRQNGQLLLAQRMHRAGGKPRTTGSRARTDGEVTNRYAASYLLVALCTGRITALPESRSTELGGAPESASSRRTSWRSRSCCTCRCDGWKSSPHASPADAPLPPCLRRRQPTHAKRNNHKKMTTLPIARNKGSRLPDTDGSC